MLLLLFYVGENAYAVDSRRVLEVLPRLHVTSSDEMPHYILGTVAIHNQQASVVDFCQLMAERPCQPVMHTRMIILTKEQDKGTRQLIVLMAEKVVETASIDSIIVSKAEKKMADKLLTTLAWDTRTCQLIDVDALFDLCQNSRL